MPGLEEVIENTRLSVGKLFSTYGTTVKWKWIYFFLLDFVFPSTLGYSHSPGFGAVVLFLHYFCVQRQIGTDCIAVNTS